LIKLATYVMALFLVSGGHLLAQSSFDKLITLPGKALDKVSSKMNSLQEEITNSTVKALKKMEKQELRLKRKLFKKDSAAANNLFNESAMRYTEMAGRLKSADPIRSNRVGEFFPYLDSLKTSLAFLDANSSMLGSSTGVGSVRNSLNSLNGVQDKLKYLSTIQQYVKERRAFLTSSLTKYGLGRDLTKLNKEAYYYSQKIREWKSVLNDPKQLKLAAFNVLNKIPAFKEFFEKNSFIARVFGGNSQFAGYASSSLIPDIPGLQSRAQVQQLVNTNLLSAGGGPGGNQDLLQQKLGEIKNELNQLKSKNSSWDENTEMPDFKPNEMKSKKFLQRLEWGTNLQFGKANAMLPSTANIGAQLAYKFHQNGSLGLGAAYKLGYGSIRRVSFTNEGIGFRSFLDYKLKGKFFVNGGFEFNYNAAFNEISQLKEYNLWQSSALLGLSKKYKLSKKMNGNLILLYDFLYREHIPASQPFVFRVGYSF
jgi:hypothetical protein